MGNLVRTITPLAWLLCLLVLPSQLAAAGYLNSSRWLDACLTVLRLMVAIHLIERGEYKRFVWRHSCMTPRGGLDETDETIKALRKKLMEAATYDDWTAAALRLDELEGGDVWKQDSYSLHYDSNLIRHRLQVMLKALKDKDIQTAMLSLRSGLSRHLGGIGSPQLYMHSRCGTKDLIREHQEVMGQLLWEVARAPEEVVPLDKRLQFLADSRHALGKTALLLSGGAGLGMYHFGVIKALWQQKLLPRVISGSSAGSIVAGIIGVCDSEAMRDLFRADGTVGGGFTDESLKFFSGEHPMCLSNLQRLFTDGVLMDVAVLRGALQRAIGDYTFHEAYEKTGRIINITVSPGGAFETPRLLNYLTAPDVLIWSASLASCALPGLFPGVELVRKFKGGHVPYFSKPIVWTDGSLHADLPTARLQELFNVNYFIVSQTNPHCLPFLSQVFVTRLEQPPRTDPARPSLLSRFKTFSCYLLASELLHRARQAIHLGIIPASMGRLINQKYEGDVTILPPPNMPILEQALSNPTTRSLEQFIMVAERRTWPTIGLIRSQCHHELILDEW
eukprot:CAMPEP_0114141932 /NCGR_PEP_ID=MMETSP0043_2-20121206/18177_1 /TAXON_ID=464988 /ORGANISM="Hemiselmis andersenii, Strain CCMP644" /LENGTH=561 /DNA_ID=CAMNT_0001236117 /DNA_START=274 /DNA_END=1956 /DNA_ORIENTATION=-